MWPANTPNQQILDALNEINGKLDRLLALREAPPAKPPSRCLTQEILKLTAEFFGLSREAILGRARPAHVAQARFFFYGALSELTHLSASSIGELCGGRDHVTIQNGLDRLKERRETWPEWKVDWQRFTAQLDKLCVGS